ncbi:MAG: hypothetical protein ACJAUC_003139, partial [Planctomycetota bacterium]
MGYRGWVGLSNRRLMLRGEVGSLGQGG